MMKEKMPIQKIDMVNVIMYLIRNGGRGQVRGGR
jgi:hypothetical protein